MPSLPGLSVIATGVLGELDPPAKVVAIPTLPGGSTGMGTFDVEVGVPLLALLLVDIDLR